MHTSELPVNIRENELTVEEKHEERNDANGTIQWYYSTSFYSRIWNSKRCANGTIEFESDLSDQGELSVNAKLDSVPVRRTKIKTSPLWNGN